MRRPPLGELPPDARAAMGIGDQTQHDMRGAVASGKPDRHARALKRESWRTQGAAEAQAWGDAQGGDREANADLDQPLFAVGEEVRVVWSGSPEVGGQHAAEAGWEVVKATQDPQQGWKYTVRRREPVMKNGRMQTPEKTFTEVRLAEHNP